MRVLRHLCIALLGIGLGSQQTLAQTATATATVAPAATSTPAAESKNKDDKSKNPLDLAFAKAAKRYKPMQRDGQNFYCRKETPLGSRLPRTVCLTKDELTDHVIASQQARDGLIKPTAGDCGLSKHGCN
jgi:hypothetical protein